MTIDEAVRCNEQLRLFMMAEDATNDTNRFLEESYTALDMAINALKQTKWIPVKERLPEKNGDYLCTILTHDYYTEDGNGKFVGRNPHYTVLICNFVDGEFPCTKYYQNYNVIAWQPLPEAYKEESE